jgi:hypothetical protein
MGIAGLMHRSFHFPLFGVHCSFVIAGSAVRAKGLLQMNDVKSTMNNGK